VGNNGTTKFFSYDGGAEATKPNVTRDTLVSLFVGDQNGGLAIDGVIAEILVFDRFLTDSK
jgi:hypothetical protein